MVNRKGGLAEQLLYGPGGVQHKISNKLFWECPQTLRLYTTFTLALATWCVAALTSPSDIKSTLADINGIYTLILCIF